MSATASDVHQRWDQAMSRSRELCSNSRRLVIVSAQVRVRSERSRLDAAAARAYRTSVEGSGREVEDFQVTGLVDGVPTMARYHGGVLHCSPELALRAEVVVAIGETFDTGDGGPPIQACLDGSATAALLTVMRAFSRVSAVELGLGGPVPDG